ncbi:pre-piRNA 3'-exonuclease trimmer-like [Vespa velutina]|uniref:pre-piRNA 3'-exonuclease trimmer-like n=1 Tax=Vespa velutina TaxID=202808 RepID=UPI001FB3637C|nr:pre-piRNA 3'-exonuclease trimmer-like [Vespa velutina]
MVEVTKKNFEKVLPMVKEALEEADFIAFDSEFTGLNSDDINSSYFNTTEEQYEYLRKTTESFIIIQFGITAVTKLEIDKYKTATYNFYLFPMSIPTKNRRFLCQVGAVEFLSSYYFDFNKVIYDGISYLNKTEKVILKQYLENDVLFKNVENNMLYKNDNEIKRAIDTVAKWLENSNKNDNVLKLFASSYNVQYFLQKVLRDRFPVIWTTNNDKEVTIFVVTLEVRKILEKEEKQNLDETLLDSYVGFTKVFNFLIDLKKPIVGHNPLLDLMYMYKLFYKSLPKNYKEFKTEIHKLFPKIFDTRCLSFQLKDNNKEDLCSSHSLGSLYYFFSEGRGSNHIPKSVTIETGYTIKNLYKAHDAGFDSYLTAYIFIKMAYVYIIAKKEETFPYDIVNGVEEFMNYINLPHTFNFYLKLDGEDPETEKPQLLFVKTPIDVDISQISKKLAPFGSFNIKPFKRNRTFIAVASHGSARDILNHFRNNKELHIVPYNPIKHSPSIRYLIFGSAFLSGGIVAWIFHRSISKSI